MIADSIIERAMRTPYQHIYNGGDLYMERYWLTPRSDLIETADGFELKAGVTWCARVHHIIRPDVDRHLHDHPMDFSSIVLKGGYWERRPDRVKPMFYRGREPTVEAYRRTGSIAFRRAHERHLISRLDGDVWTLFIMRRTNNAWGFWTPDGKIHWEAYEAYKASQSQRERDMREILVYGLATGIPGHLRAFIEKKIAE